MPPEEVQEHLRALLRRCGILLRDLRRGPVGADDQIDNAHSWAGGAGTLGFLSVAEAARAFEARADAEGAERLALSIEITLPAILAAQARYCAERA